MRKLTTQEFIDKAKSVHGDKYGYSGVAYVNAHSKVTILCKEHGDFEQTPNNHLSGKGCSKCSSTYIKTTEKFINDSILIHGDRYNYSLVNYKGSKIKVDILCEYHGLFRQEPSVHIKGHGCPECRNVKLRNKYKKTTEQFVKEAKSIHGNKYEYSSCCYINNYTDVKIICKIHGEFNQTPYNHLNGSECPKCIVDFTKNNPSGWSITNWQMAGERSKSFNSFKVYILKCYNNSEVFYKIGRTFKEVKKRFHCKGRMPYKYEIVKEFIFDNAKDAFNKEVDLKRLNKEFKYIPLKTFGGMYECFSKINLHL